MASLMMIAGAPPTSSHLSFSRTQFLGTFPISNSSSPTTTSSISLSSSSSPSFPLVYCGRGDRKTPRGKRFAGSYGNARPRNKNKGRGPPRVPVDPSAPRKDKFEDNEIIHIELDESLFDG